MAARGQDVAHTSLVSLRMHDGDAPGIRPPISPGREQRSASHPVRTAVNRVEDDAPLASTHFPVSFTELHAGLGIAGSGRPPAHSSSFPDLLLLSAHPLSHTHAHARTHDFGTQSAGQSARHALSEDVAHAHSFAASRSVPPCASGPLPALATHTEQVDGSHEAIEDAVVWPADVPTPLGAGRCAPLERLAHARAWTPACACCGECVCVCTREGKPAWPARLLDAYVLTPWWRAHVRGPAPCAHGEDTLDGNTHHRAWQPRAPAHVYMCALLGVLGLAPRCLDAMELPADASTCAVIKAAALLLVYLLAGFAYSNYVTTARRHPFVGKHGGVRDVVIVVAALPYLLWTALLPYASLVFPAPHAYGASAAQSPQHVVEIGLPVARRAGWPIMVAGTHVSTASSSVHSIILAASYLAGLHTAYLTRAGFFRNSISHKDVANSSVGELFGIAFRLLLVVVFVVDHVWWLLDRGVAWMRLPVYIAGAALLVFMSWTLRRKYYFHWHHWAAGLMLAPMCHLHSVEVSLGFFGFMLAQFVEGASRWSCAPLWHRHALRV